MKILSRYLARSFLRLLFLCLGTGVAIYLVVDFMEKVGRFMNRGGQLPHIALYFLYKLPEMVVQVAPLAVLLASLLTLGLLARTNELTAMRGSGLSLLTITRPLLLVSLAVGTALFAAGEWLLPAAEEQKTYVEDVLIAHKSPNVFFRQQNIWFRDNNRILQARAFDPDTRTLRQVTVWQVDPAMQPLERIDADQADLTGSTWLLQHPVVQTFGGGTVQTTSPATPLALPLGLRLEDLRSAQKYADTMGFFALRHYVAKLERGGHDSRRYRVQMQARLATPCAVPVLALLGIPFGTRGGRFGSIAVGVGIGILIGFAFLLGSNLLLALGQAGVLPPVAAAWGAPFIFAAAGIWLILRTEH
jgi:lipopolysaccharide export system permease protein